MLQRAVQNAARIVVLCLVQGVQMDSAAMSTDARFVVDHTSYKHQKQNNDTI